MMKPLTRIATQLELLLCLFWLASCTVAPIKMHSSAAVSQSQIVAASATSSPTYTAPKSPQPSSTSTLYPTNTPPPTGTPTPTPTLGVSSYSLRPWTEQDSEKWIENAAQIPMEGLGLPPGTVIAFQLEQLLRFPESDRWQETAWKVLRTNPQNYHVPGISLGQTVFTWMIENILNQHKIAFDDLSTYLENHQVRIVDFAGREKPLWRWTGCRNLQR